MARRNENGQFVSDDDTADDQAQPDPVQDADADGLLRDDDGGLIDPPTITSFERELQEAHAQGDDLAVQEIQDRYTEAREDKARALANRDNQEDDQ